jgi:hypothetical protein
MLKYRKRPVVIEAVRWTGDNAGEVQLFCETAIFRAHGELTIPTLEGEHVAQRGDFIIRGVKGEFYPCKPDIFSMTYEPVVEGADEQRPTMAGLRKVRERIQENDNEIALFVERVATYEANSLGFSSLSDSDNPETHRIFARRVLTMITQVVH